ncbi:MAG: hypothetical protein QG622_1724 [Actinomycetota bacterium]|nr:hypothetical protein [Actinomycetota bacterium]
MAEQIYTDPTSGRHYAIDQSTGEAHWLDAAPAGHKPKTVSGIVGLIVAVVGLSLSWVPIINNFALIFALISGFLGVIAIIATRATGKRSARWTAVATLVVTTLTIVVVLASQALYSKAINDVSKAIKTTGPIDPTGVAGSSGKGRSSDAQGVTKFGSMVTFKDRSTLTCSRPVTFKRAEYAAGGEEANVFLKSRCTFTNRSGQTFKPALSSGSMSAGGVEGEPVFQKGLDAPDNPVLNGRSVTWWMGYGVASTADVQLTVRMGFLDYAETTFT